MGFDVSYHPISMEQMNKWYFEQLENVKKGNVSDLRKMGSEAGVEEYYIEKYINTMKTAVDTKPKEVFEKTHVYYLAVVQGFFMPYYYTRGTAFSFLIDQKPEMKKYIISWNEIKPKDIECEVRDRIEENYSGGVYIPAEKVKELLADFENDSEIHSILSDFYEQNLPVFIKALKYADENKLGIAEATEVVEPNPTNLGETISYSNLMNCDKEGAFIYRDTALKQIEQFLKENNDNTAPKDVLNNAAYNKTVQENKKGGFFSKIFGKKDGK